MNLELASAQQPLEGSRRNKRRVARFGSSILADAGVPDRSKFGSSVTDRPGIPGIVIAGFIVAFIAPLIGIGLCISGISAARIRGSGEMLAVAGLIISSVLTILAVIGLLSAVV